jgi:hypothetical protein
MATIPQISSAMQRILGPIADDLGWETRYQQRQSKLTGSRLVQTLVFGGLSTSELSYTEMCSCALDAGVAISPQGLDQRFGPASAKLCQRVLEASVQVVLTGERQTTPLLERFSGIYLRDSSVINLPKELHDLWPGVGGALGESTALKLQVRLEYSRGQLAGPMLSAGRVHDTTSPYQSEALPAGAVRMGDLGFFSLKQFAADQAQGVYTFSRYKIGTNLLSADGQPIDLLAWLRAQPPQPFERPVWVGQRARFACRLLVQPVPPEVVAKRKRKLHKYARKKQVTLSAETLALTGWTLILTDIPAALLSIAEALILLRVRWQIELLFKRWKSIFAIDHWRSANPWRILTECYAKLIGVILFHWICLMEGWRRAYRSYWKAALILRHFAPTLLLALPDQAQLERVLFSILHHLQHVCRLNLRKSIPGTEQSLRTASPPVLVRTLT